MRTSSPDSDADTEWTLRLLPSHLSQLKALAEGAWPFECCGVLVGRRPQPPLSEVLDVWAARNIASDRRTRFEMAPEALIAAQRRARARDLEILGYYHSHPGHEAVPSHRDMETAWAGLSHLILEVREGRWRAARGWRIDGPDGVRAEITVLVAEAVS
jgi:proteasome lid subunit RPN8/RPN11